MSCLGISGAGLLSTGKFTLAESFGRGIKATMQRRIFPTAFDQGLLPLSPATRLPTARTLVVCLVVSLVLGPVAFAQPSRHDGAGNNLGTWTWGSSAPDRSRDVQDDDYGGTSWELLDEERRYEEELEREAEPERISPLGVPARIFRFFRPKKDEAD